MSDFALMMIDFATALSLSYLSIAGCDGAVAALVMIDFATDPGTIAAAARRLRLSLPVNLTSDLTGDSTSN